ncbi:GTP-binding protein Rho1 [Coemansia sp. S17]|nr:GTP-binding protein Rho1 [Coemansia sp. S17]
MDTRTDPQVLAELAKSNQVPISNERGKEVGRQIGATKYLECSAKTREGVDDVFREATRAALLAKPGKKNKNSRCLVL